MLWSSGKKDKQPKAVAVVVKSKEKDMSLQEMEIQLVDFFNAAADRAVGSKPGWQYKRQYARNACEILNNILDVRKNDLCGEGAKNIEDLNEIGFSILENKLQAVYREMSGRVQHCIDTEQPRNAMTYREISSQIYAVLAKLEKQRALEDDLKQVKRPAPRKIESVSPEA